eukprot:scaffold1239_cov270-Pavlova_lutheri.AAC.3
MARPRDGTSGEAMINPLLSCCCDGTIEPLHWDLDTPQKYWSQFGVGKTTLKSCVRIDCRHIAQLYICFSRILGERTCGYSFLRSSIKCSMDGKGRGGVAKNTWFECGEGNGRAPFQGICPVVQKSSIHWMRGDAGSGHRLWCLIQICELKDA